MIDKSRAVPADQVMFDLEDVAAGDQNCQEVGSTKRDVLLRD
jgi:citrate lyase beta subunit